MPQQHLHEAHVGLFQDPGRETMTKRVGCEAAMETARRSCAVEGHAGRRTGKMRGAVAVGKEPLPVAMDLPDRAKHGESRLSQGQGSLLIAFADHPQEHLLGIDG